MENGINGLMLNILKEIVIPANNSKNYNCFILMLRKATAAPCACNEI